MNSQRAVSNAVLLVFASFTLIACKSTPPPEPEQLTAPAAAEPSAPFQVPQHTFALVRVTPDRFDAAATQLDALAGGPFKARMGEDSFAERLLLWGLKGVPHRGPLAGKPGEGSITGLDRGATAYVALSTAGYEESLWRMRYGLPADPFRDFPRGYFVRMYLPATDPGTLEKWFRDSCESRLLQCSVNFEVTPGDDHVLVDFRFGDFPRVLSSAGRDTSLPVPAGDDSFTSEGTAALRTFLEADSAFGLYLRSDRLPTVAATNGASFALNALEKGSPDERAVLFERTIAFASRMFDLEAPEAREVADSAFILRHGDAIQADLILGYTELGSAVGAAMGAPADIATLEPGAIELELSYAPVQSSEQAVVPEWLRAKTTAEQAARADFLRTSGSWPTWIGAHNYSAGWMLGLQSMGMSSTMPNSTAVRGAAEVVPRTGRMPVGLQGGLVVGMSPDADLDATARQFKTMFRAFADSVKAEPAGTADSPEIHVTFGSASFGAPAPVGDSDTMSVDLERLAGAVDQFAPPVMVSGMRTAQTFKLVGVRTNSNYHLTGRLGGGDLEPLSVAVVPPASQPASKKPPCLAAVVDASDNARPGMKSGEESDPAAMVATIDAAEKTCPDAADILERMKANWLLHLGLDQIDSLDWESADQSFEQACAGGVEVACEIRSTLAGHVTKHPATLVDAPRSGGASPMAAKSQLFYSPQGFSRLSVLSYRGAALIDLPRPEGATLDSKSGRNDIARFIGLGSQPRIAVAPDLNAKQLKSLTNLVNQPGSGTTTDELSARGLKPEIGVLVRGAGGVHDLRFAPWSGTKQPLHIAISKNGITVFRNGKALKPLANCKGATICPNADIASLIGKLQQAAPADRSTVGLELARAFQVSRAVEAISKNAPQTVSIEADDTIPFAVVAGLAAAIDSIAPDPARFELVGE